MNLVVNGRGRGRGRGHGVPRCGAALVRDGHFDHLHRGLGAVAGGGRRIADVVELPKLIEVQLQAFNWFQESGLRELFDEVSPIVSFNKNLELHFLDYRFEDPKSDEEACRVFMHRQQQGWGG